MKKRVCFLFVLVMFFCFSLNAVAMTQKPEEEIRDIYKGEWKVIYETKIEDIYTENFTGFDIINKIYVNNNFIYLHDSEHSRILEISKAHGLIRTIEYKHDFKSEFSKLNKEQKYTCFLESICFDKNANIYINGLSTDKTEWTHDRYILVFDNKGNFLREYSSEDFSGRKIKMIFSDIEGNVFAIIETSKKRYFDNYEKVKSFYPINMTIKVDKESDKFVVQEVEYYKLNNVQLQKVAKEKIKTWKTKAVNEISVQLDEELKAHGYKDFTAEIKMIDKSGNIYYEIRAHKELPEYKEKVKHNNAKEFIEKFEKNETEFKFYLKLASQGWTATRYYKYNNKGELIDIIKRYNEYLEPDKEALLQDFYITITYNGEIYGLYDYYPNLKILEYK